MNKIKICHVTSAHKRYDTRIFEKECKTLSLKGYETTLLVNDEFDSELISGIKIISTGFKPKNRYQRMIKSIKLIKKMSFQIDADIYHLHDPELLRIVNFLKKNNKKVIFDSHEDYLLTIPSKHWIPNFLKKSITKMYEKYEKTIVKKLDATIVCYHWTKDRYKKVNPKTELVFNFPKIGENLISKKENYEKLNIAYAGGISKQWNHDNVLRALSLAKNRFTYLLAGSSNSKQYENSLREFSAWEQVDYKGKISFLDVQKYIYKKSLAGVALLDYIPQCKGTVGNLSNTKLFEYMAASLPIVCTNFDLWKKIIDEEKCGIYVNPNNPKEIANALDYLANNPKIAIEMGKNGRKAIISKYNWEVDSIKLIDIYKRIEG